MAMDGHPLLHVGAFIAIAAVTRRSTPTFRNRSQIVSGQLLEMEFRSMPTKLAMDRRPATHPCRSETRGSVVPASSAWTTRLASVASAASALIRLHRPSIKDYWKRRLRLMSAARALARGLGTACPVAPGSHTSDQRLWRHRESARVLPVPDLSQWTRSRAWGYELPAIEQSVIDNLADGSEVVDDKIRGRLTPHSS